MYGQMGKIQSHYGWCQDISIQMEHKHNLDIFFNALIRFGVWISRHKCLLFREKLIYMIVELSKAVSETLLVETSKATRRRKNIWKMSKTMLKHQKLL